MRPPEIDGTPVETFVGYMKKWPDIAPLWSDQLGEMVLSNLEVRDGKVYRRLPIPDHMKIAREIWEQDTALLWERVRCPVLMVPAIKESSDPRSSLMDESKASGHRDGEAKAERRHRRPDGRHDPRHSHPAPQRTRASDYRFRRAIVGARACSAPGRRA